MSDSLSHTLKAGAVGGKQALLTLGVFADSREPLSVIPGVKCARKH